VFFNKISKPLIDEMVQAIVNEPDGRCFFLTKERISKVFHEQFRLFLSLLVQKFVIRNFIFIFPQTLFVY